MMRIRPTVKIIAKPFTLVPAVDVFFLLLVFFTISSSYTFWPGEKVETAVRLPASQLATMSVADKLIITITSSGDLFFNSKPMASINDLERELREIVRAGQAAAPGEGDVAASPSRRPLVVLRADRRIAYERIVQIENLTRGLNLDVYEMLDPSRRAPTPKILDGDE